MTQTAAAVVHKQIVVQAPAEAFAVFTERLGDFKPPEHNLLTVPIAETVFELASVATSTTAAPTAASAGRESSPSTCRVGWCSAWDIGPTWQLETDPENASEVEVRFIAETPDRTRVELEHRYIDRHGPGWEAVADGVGHDQGWPLYLERYAALFSHFCLSLSTTSRRPER